MELSFKQIAGGLIALGLVTWTVMALVKVNDIESPTVRGQYEALESETEGE